ncbi:MAG TPA: beta-propeller fold lactonase family protein [Candidatus Acidoferrales bacterium]|nr:beta-propeller fold lactonase family protein [Candidatus Acidoferrales bacterium]
MKKLFLSLVLVSVILPLSIQAASKDKAAPTPLPTSKMLYPVPGTPQRTNSFPVSMATSPDGKYVAVLNAGFGTRESGYAQSIAVLEVATGKLTDFPDQRFNPKTKQDYFYGIAFNSKGSELYVSVVSNTDPTGAKEGNLGNGIAVYSFADGKLTPSRFLKIPLQPLAVGMKYPEAARKWAGNKAIPGPAGIAVIPSAQGERLLVANNLADDAVLMDAASGAILNTFDLSVSSYLPAAFPYAVVASHDGHRAWISLWNTSAVAELDLDAAKVTRMIQLERDVPVAGRPSAHASALALTPDDKWLFVALANRDIIIAISTSEQQSGLRFNAELPGEKAFGAFPTALALDDAGQRLYVANASTNSVGVYEFCATCTAKPKEPKALGFIPTQWYPTAVAVVGGKLIIASGKSTGTGPNNAKGEPGTRKSFTYVGNLIYGSVASIPTNEIPKQLKEWTAQVSKSNLLIGTPRKLDFTASGHPSTPIRHVIYVIKENRTYDQVLGDLGSGNGDSSLTMFGEAITPNQHKLARQFGVLDNFYDSGEISGNGHVWSTAAITSDYTERTWELNYRNNQRSYDYEGEVVGEFPLVQGIPNVDSPGSGYLWTNAAKSGLRYRHYGEFVNTTWCTDAVAQNSPASTGHSATSCAHPTVKKGEPLPEGMGSTPGVASPWPWAVPRIAGNMATMPELVDHFDPNFADFRLEYPDQYRADEFLREFAGFVSAREKNDAEHELPNLVVLRFPNDHTAGTKPGMPSPRASLADNDLALGRLVEAVSHSPYWDDTAILVLEDDAQDGPDHVDAHRSIALVISKYSPHSEKPFVESRFYTTVNMIRTLEDLLGMPPMNQNDAHAAPIDGLFRGKGDQPPYTADYRNRENGVLYEINPEKGPGAKASAKMDFSVADRAPAAKLNQVLWRAMKGSQPMPKPVHAVIPDTKDRD